MRKVKCGTDRAENTAEWCVICGMRKVTTIPKTNTDDDIFR